MQFATVPCSGLSASHSRNVINLLIWLYGTCTTSTCTTITASIVPKCAASQTSNSQSSNFKLHTIFYQLELPFQLLNRIRKSIKSTNSQSLPPLPFTTISLEPHFHTQNGCPYQYERYVYERTVLDIVFCPVVKFVLQPKSLNYKTHHEKIVNYLTTVINRRQRILCRASDSAAYVVRRIVL